MTYLGASVAYMFNQGVLWHGRADSAWGPSRVWSSGTSWETLYNNQSGTSSSLQSQLTAMTADRDAWKSRADQAWGPSRSWSSGNSWEQMYNASAGGAPPAGGAVIVANCNFDNQLYYADQPYQVNFGGWNAINTTYFDNTAGNLLRLKRTGYYTTHARVKAQYSTVLEIRKNFGGMYGTTTDGGDGSAWTVCPEAYFSQLQFFNANDHLTVWERSRVGTYYGVPSFFETFFIPTTSYPS